MGTNLETNRFLLKERTQSEIMRLCDLTDEEICKVLNLKEVEELAIEKKRMNRLLARSEDVYYLWDIFDRDTLEVIGNLGFHNYIKEHRRSEIGYMCYPTWQNKGVVTESLKEVIRFGFNTLSLIRIEAFLDVDNIASESVLKKLNFIKEGTLRSHYIRDEKICDSLVYSMLSSEFEY